MPSAPSGPHEGHRPTYPHDPHKKPPVREHRGRDHKGEQPVISTKNNPPVHQPREHACACRACGVRVTGRRVEPRTMTWNVSGLCDRHEALSAEATA